MLEAHGLSDRGSVRPNNEDSYRIEPGLGVCLVADGMGGAKAGERASALAADAVVDWLSRVGNGDPEALIAAVREANRRVVEAARADSALEGMGTTLVAAVETPCGAFVASVGDSRAYVMDGGGLHLVTEDDSWVNQVGRPLGLDEASLRSHPMRHLLTRAIGVAPSVPVKTYDVPLDGDSVLLLCTDGLHGVVDGTVIEQVLRGAGDAGDLQVCCRALVDAAIKRGGPDNVTVVLLRKARSGRERRQQR